MNIRLSIALLILSGIFPRVDNAANLDRHDALSFVHALTMTRDSLETWLDKSAVDQSDRLGIRYADVPFKCLIGNDIDDTVRTLIASGILTPVVAVDSSDRDYAIVKVSIPSIGVSQQYFFRGNRCVCPLTCMARGWKIIESAHFRIYVSDTTRINRYSIEWLEKFLGKASGLLGLSESDLRTLERGKIWYFLCRDEEEVRRLIGFQARGIGNLAYDAVISTYPAHVHELLHLLINFKLKSLPLFANSLLREGFAVAFGGRGGMSPEVLRTAGRFLVQSGYVELDSLLSQPGFERDDPSVSYPVAGLYNRFLIEKLGMPAYLELYRRHCGRREGADLQISELPDPAEWLRYLARSEGDSIVVPDTAIVPGRIASDKAGNVTEDEQWYHFDLAGSCAISGDSIFDGYSSASFREFFPDVGYHGEWYMIRCSETEIAVYNCLTNTLIASYSTAFSLHPAKSPVLNGRYRFKVMKRLFGGALVSIRNPL